MAELEDILVFISNHKFKWSSKVRLRPSDRIVLIYIPSDAIGERVTKTTTSWRQMKSLTNEIKSAFGLDTQYIIVGGKDLEMIEAGLKALLEKRFPNELGDYFISLSGPTDVEMWVDIVKSDKPHDEHRNELNKIVNEYFKLFCRNLVEIHWISNYFPLPTEMIILRIVKTYQPISIQALVETLKANNYTVPSDAWMQNKVDKMRKGGFLVWQKDHTYVTTAKTLSAVPHGAFRSSSDIERALALGKKKW